MALAFDPEVEAGLAPLLAASADTPLPPVGDVAARREGVEAMMTALAALQPMPTDVSRASYQTTSADGATIALRWCRKDGASPGPGVVYLHGGGMILGSVDLYDATVARYVSQTGVSMLAVDYRLSPEAPHPAPVEDCYAGLRWLADHARELDVDPERIAVMGDSAGGGLAAGVALLARDRGGPALARQILIYPMLDDRTVIPDEFVAPFATWSYDDNVTGWQALLGDAFGTDDISMYAAPARAVDLSGLPPAYLDVGQMDAFRDEDLEYGKRLSAAGVPTELHLHPGAPHAFESFAPEAAVARRALADRHRVLRSL